MLLRGAVPLVQINRYDKANETDDYESFNNIEEFVHPLYNVDTFANDFLVIKLDGAATTAPLQLNSDPNFPPDGFELTAVGWGDMDPTEEEDLPDVLQQVTLNAISNDECELAKRPSGVSYMNRILPSMICTYDENKDSCQGDSGGPILSLGATSNEDVVVGVVSWYVFIIF